jgi:hypothetical protein
MNELSVLETELGKLEAQQKMIIDASKVKCETTAPKNESKGSSSHLTYFAEHLTSVFGKTTERVQYGLEKLESFDPVTQERYRLHLQQSTHNQKHNLNTRAIHQKKQLL